MLEQLNRYCHGYAGIPIIIACKKNGLFSVLQANNALTQEQLCQQLHANSGHLQVALHFLVSIDWLKVSAGGEYSLTNKAVCQESIPDELLALYSIQPSAWLTDKVVFRWLKKLLIGWDVQDERLPDFLDGVLIIPLLMNLKIQAWVKLENHFITLTSKLKNKKLKQRLIEIFKHKNWMIEDEQAQWRLTEEGEFLFERVINAGVIYSYRPLLAQMEGLLFGDCVAVFARNEQCHEQDLDRQAQRAF